MANKAIQTMPLKAETASDQTLTTLMQLDAEDVYGALASSPDGLIASEVDARLAHYGPNRIGEDKQPTLLDEIWARARNPLNGLLLALSFASYMLGDARAAIVIAAMVVLAVVAAFIVVS